jgi:hypothetical protein
MGTELAHPRACPFFLIAAGLTQCGTSVCYNNATQCCADPATSMVGDRFNGGCYQTPYCRLDYKLLDGTIVSIAGELPPSVPSP